MIDLLEAKSANGFAIPEGLEGELAEDTLKAGSVDLLPDRPSPEPTAAGNEFFCEVITGAAISPVAFSSAV